MRLVLAGLVFALAACRHHGAPEPAWPKSAGHVAPKTWEEDGGESLEPQGDTSIENSDDGEPPVEELDADLQALIDLALTNQTSIDAPVDDNRTSDEMIIIDDDVPVPAETP